MDFFLTDVPPAAYSPFEWPEYYIPYAYPDFFKPHAVGTTPPGGRSGIWPLYFEEYRSDTEPVLAHDPSAPPRIVQWHRLTRTDTPPGWWQVPGSGSMFCMGLYNDLQENYKDHWKKKAAYYSRHIQKELIGKIYTIEPITFATFTEAFAHSTVAREIPTLEIKKLSKRLELFPEKISMWGVRRLSDNTVVAGLSAFDSTENKASHYGCGFYLPEVHKDHLMVGLMDVWFAASVQKKLRVLHLGLFAPPGKGSGRGKSISEFKAQFITHYHQYQHPLLRFKTGKLF